VGSIGDYLSTSAPSTPLAWQFIQQTPQYNVNSTESAIRQDSAESTSRAIQDYSQRTLPDLVNQSAAMGNFGSSGAKNKIFRAGVDSNRNMDDIQKAKYRNLTSIAKQKMMATMGGMF
jgi:hypothetical protein